MLSASSLSAIRITWRSSNISLPSSSTRCTESASVLHVFKSILRYACTSPLESSTITGIVLFPFMTFNTRLMSVFSSALFSVRIASAQTAILLCSSLARSRIRRCDTTSDATAIITAASTRNIFTLRIWSVHCI